MFLSSYKWIGVYKLILESLLDYAGFREELSRYSSSYVYLIGVVNLDFIFKSSLFDRSKGWSFNKVVG